MNIIVSFVLVFAGLLLGLVVLVLGFSMARFLAMTRKTIPLPTSGTLRMVARDVPLSSEPVPAMDVYAPAELHGRPPLILFVPGDGPDNVISRAKEWGIFRSHAALATDRGYVAAVANHRSSRNYRESARMVEDVTKALDVLKARADDLGFDKDRVVVWTFSGSAGPVLSHFLRAPSPNVRALLSFYGLLDLSALPAKVPAKVPASVVMEYSLPEVLEHMEEIPCPVYLVHARRDHAAITRGFVRVVGLKRPLALRICENGKHGFEILSPAAEVREEIDRAYAFIEEALRRSPGRSARDGSISP